MNHDQIAAVITRHAQDNNVRPESMLIWPIPAKGSMIVIKARRGAMAELNQRGMTVAELSRLFRVHWMTAKYHVQLANGITRVNVTTHTPGANEKPLK